MLKEPGRVRFNPSQEVKVISSSVTFYPPKGNNEEGLTLLNSCAFVRENFGETAQCFTTENNQVVLQSYANGSVLFAISSQSNYSIELLRFILQILRNLAKFLFGEHFENVMLKEIKQSSKDVFARYVEKIFDLINQDYKALLGIYEGDPIFYSLSVPLRDILVPLETAPLIVETFLFCNNHFIARSHRKGKQSISPSDVFQISVLELLEFPQTEDYDPFDFSTFDENPPVLVHKGCNICYEGSFRTGILTGSRLGEHSPYVVLCLSFTTSGLPPELPAQASETIMNIRKQLFENHFKKPPIVVPQVAIGLVHYLVIDRTTGQTWELTHPNHKEQLNDPDETKRKNAEMFDTIERKMASIAMEAIFKGYTAMVRNDFSFQYTYELRIFEVKSKHFKKIPHQAPIGYDEDLCYNMIPKKNDANDRNVHVIELMTVYLAVLNTIDVLQMNSEFITSLLENAFSTD